MHGQALALALTDACTAYSISSISSGFLLLFDRNWILPDPHSISMYFPVSYIFIALAAPWTVIAQNYFVYPPPTTLAYNATLLVPPSPDLLVLYVGTTVNLQWTTSSTTPLGLHLQNTNTTLPNSQYIIKGKNLFYVLMGIRNAFGCYE